MRPSWACQECGGPWPCGAAWRDLATEYADTPVALAVYLAGCYLECLADPPAVPSEDLYFRFLGWIRPHGSAHASDPAQQIADDLVLIESSNDIALRDADW